MKNKKLTGYLGLARRAGKLLSGYKTCQNYIGKGSRIKLMIIAADASQKTQDRFTSLCKRYGVPVYIYGLTDELSQAAGLPGRGIYAVTDSNFAEAMIKEIENEQIVPK